MERETSSSEQRLSPLDRMKKAREAYRTLGRLGEQMGNVAQFEILTRYVEKYPDTQTATDIIRIFDDMTNLSLNTEAGRVSHKEAEDVMKDFNIETESLFNSIKRELEEEEYRKLELGE